MTRGASKGVTTSLDSLDTERLRRDLYLDLAREPDHPDYEIGGLLGRGGMGSVYRALDRKLQRYVALKVLRHDLPGFDRRFSQEALSTARLEHPNILPVFDRGELSDGRPFYTMRLVEGRELGELLTGPDTDDDGRLRAIVRVLATVCEALGYAHGHGFVHRDIKPANLLVGENGAVWVVDWGLLAQPGQATGTDEEHGPTQRGAPGDTR